MFRSVLALAPLALVLALPVAGWRTQASAPAGLAEEMRAFVEPSGLWRAANPEAGRPGQPSEYGLEYAFGLERRLVTLRIFAAFPDGSERDLWFYVTVANPLDGRIEVRGFGANGWLTEGRRAPGERTLDLACIGAGLGTFGLREVHEILGPDDLRTRSYERRGDEYVLSQELLWERQPLEREK